MDTGGCFFGVKRPVRDANHSSLNTGVVELYLNSRCVFVAWCFIKPKADCMFRLLRMDVCSKSWLVLSTMCLSCANIPSLNGVRWWSVLYEYDANSVPGGSWAPLPHRLWGPPGCLLSRHGLKREAWGSLRVVVPSRKVWSLVVHFLLRFYDLILQYWYYCHTDRLCGIVVRVPGYRTDMYCVSC
jgi:hypothetical protein